MKIKELPVEERPRERLKKIGAENVSNEELLAILLKCGTKDKSVKYKACEVLTRIQNIHNLENINYHTFDNIKGLGNVKKIEIMAAIELGKRIFLSKGDESKIIYNKLEIIYLNNKYLFQIKKKE